MKSLRTLLILHCVGGIAEVALSELYWSNAHQKLILNPMKTKKENTCIFRSDI